MFEIFLKEERGIESFKPNVITQQINHSLPSPDLIAGLEDGMYFQPLVSTKFDVLSSF